MSEQNTETVANSTPVKVVRRKGSGRTKGSFSFVKVSLAELETKFADRTTPIVVGRIWAQSCGFADVKSAPVGAIISQIQGKTPETKPAIAMQSLD